MIERMRTVLDGLVVRPEAMQRNLDATGGLVYSQSVLLALTETWGDRDRAYRVVQAHAMVAWEAGGSFRDRLLDDADVCAALTREGLAALFDPTAFTRNLGGIFERTLATAWGKA
jgi:adenylosuccinate lyase